MRSKPLNTSSLVMTSAVMELMRAAYFRATRSSQPVRRGRPVVVPNSPPRSRISAPTSSSSSVGNGPAPTRVVYAFAIPQTSSMSRGPTPAPPQAAPATGFDEVTNGYVPWSMSSSAPCAPSKTTTRPSSSARCASVVVSAMNCSRRWPYVRYSSLIVWRFSRGSRANGRRLSRFGSRAAMIFFLRILVEHVLDADAQARRLVGVAGSDATLRRPDLELAELRLAGMVEHEVIGHDQMRVGRDLQAADVDAPRAQVVDLVGEDLRVDHD